MNAPVLRSFRISGLTVHFRCGSPELAGAGLAILEHHGLKPSIADGESALTAISSGADLADAAISLNAGPGGAAIPDEARVLVVHESGLEILHLDRYRYLQRGEAQAKIDLTRRHVQVVVPAHSVGSDGRVGTDLYLMIIFGLIMVLQECGRYALHAAALRSPEGDGILIVASSDAGKSTMTMHLARQGWSYVTDDAVLLFSRNDVVEASSFRRNFGLDPDAVESFPEIERYSEPVIADSQKLQVHADRLFPGKRVDDCVPRVLIVPEIVGSARSRLMPLKASDAFLSLMRQASFLTPEASDGALQAGMLSKLVGQTQAFRLEAGEDIKRDGPLLAKVLAKALARNAS